MAETLVMYTIYDGPRDYPERIVVRAWDVTAEAVKPNKLIAVVDDVDDARANLRAMGLQCIGRTEGDDPVIVETWV